MTKRSIIRGSILLLSMLVVWPGYCDAAAERMERYNGLTVAASRGLRIAALTGNLMQTIEALNRLAHWDKFFMTPQRHLEPSQLRQATNQADVQKFQRVWLHSALFGTLRSMQRAGLLMSGEEDAGSLSLAVEFFVQSTHGLVTLYTANRTARDLMTRWYVRPQRALIGKECLVCYEENKDNTLIAPCGNMNHHICVTCYPRLVGGAQYYECLLCRCKVPKQEVRLNSVSIFEEVQHLSNTNRQRICGLLLGQCIVLICLYLHLRTLFRDGDPETTFLDALLYPVVVLSPIMFE